MSEVAQTPAPVNPFDTTELKTRLKAKALGVLKPFAKDMASEVVDWAAAGCVKHPNTYVKILGPVVAGVKAPIHEAIDKIGL